MTKSFATSNQNETLWISYLRSFITFLVVVHHSALSYTTFARFDSEVYIRSTHVIVDSERWGFLDLLVDFNDIYFMSLMFLIGGLFLDTSIRKKGVRTFLKDRTLRLFVPFLFIGTLFMLLAYYPAYLIATGDQSISAYVLDFFTLQAWPVGPPWFVWVLFLFNIILVFYRLFRDDSSSQTYNTLPKLGDKPLKLFSLLFIITTLAYVPLSLLLGMNFWTGIGPFDVQLNRFLLYLTYFFIGVYIGTTDFKNNIFSQNARWISYWKAWILIAILAFTLKQFIPSVLLGLVQNQVLPEILGWTIFHTIFAFSCTASCIALVACFRTFIRIKRGWWDSFSENAYMIYLCHFIFVVWFQYLLIDLNQPAFIKFLIVTLASLFISWLFCITARKISFLKKYV